MTLIKTTSYTIKRPQLIALLILIFSSSSVWAYTEQGSGIMKFYEFAMFPVLVLMALITASIWYVNHCIYKSQNLAFLIQYLESSAAREARWAIYNVLSKRKYKDWDDNDINCVATVLAALKITAIYMENGMINNNVIFQNYTDTIKRIYEYEDIKVFIEARNEEMGPMYYRSIKWLYDENEKYRKK